MGYSFRCKYLSGGISYCHDNVALCSHSFGEGEGRPRVYTGKDLTSVTAQMINAKRAELYAQLAYGIKNKCIGCVHLLPVQDTYTYDAEAHNKVTELQISCSTLCQLKCQYCYTQKEDVVKADAKIYAAIVKLHKAEELAQNVHVTWGGGEPTIMSEFVALLKLFERYAQSKHTVLTNAVIVPDKLLRLIKSHDVRIVTSLDAGTAATYVTVRGAGLFDTVLANLRVYYAAMTDKSKLTLKYVIVDANSTKQEFDSFCAVASQFTGCGIVLDIDFSREITPTKLEHLSYLYRKLYNKFAVSFSYLTKSRVPFDIVDYCKSPFQLDKYSLGKNISLLKNADMVLDTGFYSVEYPDKNSWECWCGKVGRFVITTGTACKLEFKLRTGYWPLYAKYGAIFKAAIELNGNAICSVLFAEATQTQVVQLALPAGTNVIFIDCDGTVNAAVSGVCDNDYRDLGLLMFGVKLL